MPSTGSPSTSFGPDETASNRLGDVFQVTNRAWHAEVASTDEGLSTDGRVLEVLSERQGAVISKQALLQRVWQDDSDEHAVEVTVGRLRRRLGAAGGSIETVMRRGYRLAAG